MTGAEIPLILGGLAAGTLLSAAVSRKKPPPPPPPPTPMPTVNDARAQEAARRRAIAEMSRRGRASTILTDPDSGDKLGG